MQVEQTRNLAIELVRRIFRFRLATLLLAVIPFACVALGARHYMAKRPIRWVKYSARGLEDARKDGQTVLVNFTARWDLSTVRHEKLALETPSVRRRLWSRRITAMKADYTTHSPDVAAAMKSVGVTSIPAVVVFPPGLNSEPIVLRDLMTERQVLNALDSSNNRRTTSR